MACGGRSEETLPSDTPDGLDTEVGSGGADSQGGAPSSGGSAAICRHGDIQHGSERCGPTGEGYVRQLCTHGQWEDTPLCDHVDGVACIEGVARASSTPCGLNGRGTTEEKCTSKAWLATGACLDPDECFDGTLHPETQACGSNGGTEEVCVRGQWVDSVCVECIDATLDPGVDPCGFNGNGTLERTCIASGWNETGVCLDPDICAIGERIPGTTACGLNGAGWIELECTGPTWIEGTCLDPDVCTNGEKRLGPTTCGAHGQWKSVESCVDGQWSEECADSFVSIWYPDDRIGYKIVLPLVENGAYDFTVFWGDGTQSSISAWDDPAKEHTYSGGGDYTVQIVGHFEGWSLNPGFEFDFTHPNVWWEYDQLAQKAYNQWSLVSILRWGPISLGDTESQFAFALGLRILAEDAPDLSKTKSLRAAFMGCQGWMESELIEWDTSTITDLTGTFFAARGFLLDISDWDTSNVTRMDFLFMSTFGVPGDLSGWDTSNVTSMRSMFAEAELFDLDPYISLWKSDISQWDTGNVTTMREMFYHSNVSQGLSGWDFSSVVDMTDMFYWISTENYDALLTSWAGQSVQSNVSFGAETATYSAAAGAARQSLIDDHGWTFVDAGQF